MDLLVADPSKASARLGWRPEVSFDRLVEMMVEADLERYARQGHAVRVGARAGETP